MGTSAVIRRLVLLVLGGTAALGLCGAGGAPETWRIVRSAHFIVIGNDSGWQTRLVARELPVAQAAALLADFALHTGQLDAALAGKVQDCRPWHRSSRSLLRFAAILASWRVAIAVLQVLSTRFTETLAQDEPTKGRRPPPIAKPDLPMVGECEPSRGSYLPPSLQLQHGGNHESARGSEHEEKPRETGRCCSHHEVEAKREGRGWNAERGHQQLVDEDVRQSREVPARENEQQERQEGYREPVSDNVGHWQRVTPWLLVIAQRTTLRPR